MRKFSEIRFFQRFSLFSPRLGPLPVPLLILILLGLSIGLPLALLPKGPPDLKTLCKTEVPENHWQYIVLHHSGTSQGSATSFDSYHRNVRGWEHGLGYHFVIGNGTHSGDGEIEVAGRWRSQLQGAHAGDTHYNRLGIGICLVGNFEEDGGPTKKQFKSLVMIVHYLSERYHIPLSGIVLHKEVLENHTACPGKNFPYEKFMERLRRLASRNTKGREV